MIDYSSHVMYSGNSSGYVSLNLVLMYVLITVRKQYLNTTRARARMNIFARARILRVRAEKILRARANARNRPSSFLGKAKC